jgi:DNA-directed RNA polymerase subunit alpha
MHIIQEEIGIPKVATKELGDHHMLFTFGPLPQGFGMTLGNAMRRVLISSIPGTAVTGVKIAGVKHEYTTLEGVHDSMLDAILNLKRVAFKMHGSEPVMVRLQASKGEVTAKNIETTADVEVLNKDHLITSIDKGADKLDIQIRLEKGVGYKPVAAMKQDEPDIILIDASFSPVTKVHFQVGNTRVGQRTNLDQLELEIETNGAITPQDAFLFASNILTSYFSFFNESSSAVEQDFIVSPQEIAAKQQVEEEQAVKTEYTPIEILNFSPRTLNALINGGIGSIEQLTQCTESKLANLRGFGKKAMDEVKEALKKRNLSLLEE